MPVTPVPITEPASIDLVTGAYCTDVLSAGGLTLSAAQVAVQASLITAASREIIRYLGNRPIAAANYIELVSPEGTRQDRGEPATAKLKRFPVLSITRCATGRTTALTVTNTSTANQEASVAFTMTGDPEFDDWIYTGLTLSRTASGTVTPNTITWTTASPYTTIASVATSINALGGGWSATATTGGAPDLSLLPAAYLVGAREPQDALSSAGATLSVFGTTYSAYGIERSSGILSCRGLAWGAGSWGFGGFGYDGYDDAPGGWGYPQVEVRYRSGWEVVPSDLQLVCAEVVQLMLTRLTLDPSLEGETADKYTWKAAAKEALGNLSDGARATLVRYKDGWL